MIIMCMFCRNSITVESTTTHVVNVQNYTIIVKNVLCLECEQCGKKYYTDEVAEQLENIINMPELLIHEYYGAAEPPVRCGESHLSGLTEPPHFVY